MSKNLFINNDISSLLKEKEKFENEELKVELEELIRNKNNLGFKFPLIQEKNEDGISKEDILKNNYITLKTKNIIGNLESKNNHYLIRGDNLFGLKSLLSTHKKKINIIYIDPPYNTGGDGFPYLDSYKRSSWLSFMKRRLTIAKELLTEDGVIFISIDDNEQAYLKVLMDEIFGENNFLGCIAQLKGNAQNDAKNIQKNHDYLLVYSKNEYGKSILKQIKDNDKKIYTDNWGKKFTKGSRLVTGGANTLYERPNLGYTIFYNRATKDIIAYDNYYKNNITQQSRYENVYFEDEYTRKLTEGGYVSILPPKNGNILGRWTWKMEKVNLEKNDLYINENLNIYKKDYLSSEVKHTKNIKSFINLYEDKNFIQFSTGTEKFNKIMEQKKMFENPKSVNLIKYILNSYYKHDVVVLDFFAGSGTTSQAVMELNKEDGGSRQFIGIQLPEDQSKENKSFETDTEEWSNKTKISTLDEITIERIRRVIEGTNLKGEKLDKFEPCPDNKLTVLDIDFIHKYNVSNNNIDMSLYKELLGETLELNILDILYNQEDIDTADEKISKIYEIKEKINNLDSDKIEQILNIINGV